MRNKTNKRKSIIRIIVALEILVLVVLVGFFIHLHKDSDTDVVAEEQIVTENGTISGNDNLLASILLASDYQYEPGWDEPKESLNSLIDAAIADGKSIDNVIMCGDYSNEYRLYDYQVSPEESIAEITSIVENKCPSITSEDIIYIQGNHDALTESISETGLHDCGDYLVYVLNTQNDFPWCQGKTSGCLDKVKRASSGMKTCFNELIEKRETRPVIIAGHVPLHFTARTSSRHTTGDNLYSSLIFDVVNEAAQSLDIIYLFGHNHSKGWDCYLGGGAIYKQIGDELLVPKYDEVAITTDVYTEEQLNFTYLNAGYVGYYMNCGESELASGLKSQYDAADMSLTATVLEIYPDRMILTRYDKDGVHNIGSTGCANPYKNGVDKGLIPDSVYAKTVMSPQIIERRHL